MRLVETCRCGASIEISWNEPKSYATGGQDHRESERAKSEVTKFRSMHKPCREQYAK